MHWHTQLMGSIKKWHLSESEPRCILALQGSSQTAMWSPKCCTNCRPGPSTPWAAPGVPRLRRRKERGHEAQDTGFWVGAAINSLQPLDSPCAHVGLCLLI